MHDRANPSPWRAARRSGRPRSRRAPPASRRQRIHRCAPSWEEQRCRDRRLRVHRRRVREACAIHPILRSDVQRAHAAPNYAGSRGNRVSGETSLHAGRSKSHRHPRSRQSTHAVTNRHTLDIIARGAALRLRCSRRGHRAVLHVCQLRPGGTTRGHSIHSSEWTGQRVGRPGKRVLHCVESEAERGRRNEHPFGTARCLGRHLLRSRRPSLPVLANAGIYLRACARRTLRRGLHLRREAYLRLSRRVRNVASIFPAHRQLIVDARQRAGTVGDDARLRSRPDDAARVRAGLKREAARRLRRPDGCAQYGLCARHRG